MPIPPSPYAARADEYVADRGSGRISSPPPEPTSRASTRFRSSSPAHAVQPAYRWPVDLLVSVLETTGFHVDHTETRSERPDRDHGAILATRRG